MAQYHINKTTGEVGPGRAEVSCPLGNLETEHYEDAAHAREAYEAMMSQGVMPAPVRVKRSLMDRLKGLSEEDVAARARIEEEEGLRKQLETKIREFQGLDTFITGSYSQRAFMDLFKTANQYKARQTDALVLFDHYMALEQKAKKLEIAANSLAR